jgi:hypothetical protein
MKIFPEGLSVKIRVNHLCQNRFGNKKKGSDSAIYQRKIAFIFIAFYLELDLF